MNAEVAFAVRLITFFKFLVRLLRKRELFLFTSAFLSAERKAMARKEREEGGCQNEKSNKNSKGSSCKLSLPFLHIVSRERPPQLRPDLPSESGFSASFEVPPPSD